MARETDHSWEALVEVTNANVAAERGALNTALKQIREHDFALEDEDLAMLIRLRSEQYRRAYPEIALTPTALAKHWLRVEEEQPKVSYPDFNRPLGRCDTCNGDKMVLVGHIPAVGTQWTRERGIEPSKHPAELGHDQYAPCPDCNSDVDAGFWRADGSRFTPLDPARVRERMGQ